MKNRRRGPDFIINVIKWISIVLWVLIAIVFIIIIIMKPTSSGMEMSRPTLHGVSSKGMSNAILGFLVIQLVLSIAGIIFNVTRLKRKTDTLRLTLVFSTIVAIAGLLFFLL